MRVRVLARCDLRPSANLWVDFKPGEYTTKRAWGQQLVAAGKATEIKEPRTRAEAVTKTPRARKAKP